MPLNRLPADTDELLALAEEVANVIREDRIDLEMTKDAETFLQAEIARAMHARNAYLTILAAAHGSRRARTFLAAARRANDRAVRQLRRRLKGVLAQNELVLTEV
jgi:hypothetical protein